MAATAVNDEMLTAAELAALLRISTRQLQRLRAAGLPH